MIAVWWEDVEIGATRHYGDVLVTAEAIIAFAKAYDPQPFHLSEEAGRASHFGGLVASGWHSAALWMRMTVEHSIGRDNPAAMGSPGFRDMRWHEPVRPGDRLSCRTTIIERVAFKSREDVGLIRSRNEMLNQHGRVVMSFTGQGLIRKRPKDEGATT